MGNKNNDNVILVFESASDAHWMKDVVQFPNALAQNLFNKNAILLTRPNHRQEELASHIELVYQDVCNEKNIINFETQNFSNIITNPLWYLNACKRAASLGAVLVLYPFYGNPYKGAQYFKLKRWLEFRKAYVIIKSDGTLYEKSTYKATNKQKLSDFIRYFFINKIVCENEQIYTQLKSNHPHLLSKLVYLPNCPLDIYFHQQIVPYVERPDNFLFVGRADDKEKGIDVLLDAWIKIFSTIPGWKLLIAGPCSESLKKEWNLKLKKENALDTVQWLGPASPNELIQHYNNAKIVVCPSRKESGPIVLSEAILSGCSFIGTNVGEIPTVLNGLPGLVTTESILESQMLFFVLNREIAHDQAKSLFDRMKDRSWAKQTQKIAASYAFNIFIMIASLFF